MKFAIIHVLAWQVLEALEMKLGDHYVLGQLLGDIFTQRNQHLVQMAHRLGIPRDEAEDVVHETYLRLHRLLPRGNIAEIAGRSPVTAEDIDKLRAALTALIVYYLKLSAKDFFRQAATRPYPLGETAEILPASTDSSDLCSLVTNLGPLPSEDMDALSRGSLPSSLAFYERLAKCAGLTSDEAHLVMFLIQHPEQRDQDFRRDLRPHKISRMKKAAFEKIARFLGLDIS